MARQKDTVIRERDRLNNEVDELTNKLQSMKEYLEELETAKQAIENKNKELYKLLDETSSESFKDKRLLESLKAELQEVAASNEQRAEEAKHFKTKSEASHKSSMQQNVKVSTDSLKILILILFGILAAFGNSEVEHRTAKHPEHGPINEITEADGGAR